MKALFIPALAAAAVFVSSCSKNDSGSSSGTSHMNVYMTDDPALYSSVKVDVQDVQVHVNGDTSEGSWQSVHVLKAGVYDLLDLSNGKDTLLASADVPAGKITQMRLVLGSNNSVTANGAEHTLITPSAQQSGLKLNIDQTLNAGVSYSLWLDFDAGKSIVKSGSDYILKPVIRAYTKAETGAVKGYVLPITADASVYVMASATDTVATAMPDPQTGYFQVNGLAAGSYTLVIHSNIGLGDLTVNNVAVATGDVTDAGTIKFQ
ncbi:MAG TPA: DUF4382 domain-containing protein [Chitinophagaceae bacterium]|nr:DUF4382 domain-containing protein [Chitinophagaceae bacterium]